MVPQRRAEPGHLGVLALVGLCVCIGESPVAPPRRMDGLATRLRGVSIPSGDLALGTGVGCREKEQEGRRQRQRREGGRLLPWKELQGILGSEFSLQRTGLRGVGGMVGEGDGEASVLLCPWRVPTSPQTEWSPHAPGTGPPRPPPCPPCPPASCTEGRGAPSRRPVYQHDNSKLVLLKGIQHLSRQTSSPQRGPLMPSPRNLLKWGLLCILIDFLPPTTLNAFNLLLQMANFENPLIRIRSSTSIFIYFSFSSFFSSMCTTEFRFRLSGSISQVPGVGWDGVGVGWARAGRGANWKWTHGRDGRSGFRNYLQGSEGCALLCGEPSLGSYEKLRHE